MKKLYILPVLVLLTITAFSQFNFYATAVYLSLNNNLAFYNNTKPAAAEQVIGSKDFQNTLLGTFPQNSNEFILVGAEVRTMKATTGNVCGATLYFTVYPANQRPANPSFIPVTLGLYADCQSGVCSSFAGNFNQLSGGGCCSIGDQKWQTPGGGNNGNIDLTTLVPGDYTLELYYQVTGQSNGSGCTETLYDNNSSAPTNYTAFFTISETLPVRFGYITAVNEQGKNRINWSTVSETDSKVFFVERSADGKNFVSVGTVPAKGNAPAGMQYQYIDRNPVKGANYYRVKMLEFSGHSQFSRIVQASENSWSPIIAPNPARNQATLAGIPSGSLIRLISSTGATLKQYTATSNSQVLSLGNLPPGRYTVQVFNEGKLTNLPLIIMQ